MTCRTIFDDDGRAIGIACTRGRERRCSTVNCDKKMVKLCDYPTSKGTCDRPLCDRCAVNVGPDRDYCPPHAKKLNP